MNAFLHRIENNVTAEFDKGNEFCLQKFSMESASALEAQREVLAHQAAEEIQRRDSKKISDFSSSRRI